MELEMINFGTETIYDHVVVGVFIKGPSPFTLDFIYPTVDPISGEQNYRYVYDKMIYRALHCDECHIEFHMLDLYLWPQGDLSEYVCRECYSVRNKEL